MKIGNVNLRLDPAHNPTHNRNKNRNRYNSFNSTGNNNSNHHHHHQHHHHNFSNSSANNNNHHHHHPQHHQSHSHHGGSQQHRNENKNLLSNSNAGSGGRLNTVNVNAGQHKPQQSQQQQPSQVNQANHSSGPNTNHSNVLVSSNSGTGAGNSSRVGSNSNVNLLGQHHNTSHPSQHNSHPNHNNYNSSSQSLSSSSQPSLDNPNTNKNSKPKQPSQPPGNMNTQPANTTSSLSHTLPHQSSNQQSPPASSLTQPSITPLNQIASQQPLSSNSSNSTHGGANLNLASSSITNSHNLNTNQQSVGPDLRGHYSFAAGMMESHLLNTTEQPSMMPPTSVYGHLYSYGPPPFGYMPTQPNPMMPISGVTPAPPQQSPSTTGVNQQHGGHSLPAPSATTRYNSGGHHHQPQPHSADSAGLNTLPGGVQGPHQGPPLYYYYPSPLYYDHQSGGAAPPPSIYHTQPFHPQFFAMPNPYMSNAQTYNQHQPQPQSSSQSDTNVVPNQQQPSPQQSQQSQQQVMRTRDIDATTE